MDRAISSLSVLVLLWVWPTLLLDRPAFAPDSDAAIADWLALAGDVEGASTASIFSGDTLALDSVSLDLGGEILALDS